MAGFTDDDLKRMELELAAQAGSQEKTRALALLARLTAAERVCEELLRYHGHYGDIGIDGLKDGCEHCGPVIEWLASKRAGEEEKK